MYRGTFFILNFFTRSYRVSNVLTAKSPPNPHGLNVTVLLRLFRT